MYKTEFHIWQQNSDDIFAHCKLLVLLTQRVFFIANFASTSNFRTQASTNSHTSNLWIFFFLKQKISILPLVVISLSCHFYGLLNPSNFYFYEILSCCSELFIKSCTHLMKGYWPPKIFILWTQCSRSAFWRSEFELLFDCVSWMSSSNGFEAPSP